MTGDELDGLRRIASLIARRSSSSFECVSQSTTREWNIGHTVIVKLVMNPFPAHQLEGLQQKRIDVRVYVSVVFSSRLCENEEAWVS